MIHADRSPKARPGFRSWKLTKNSWRYTTIYNHDDYPLCRLDLEDWGVTEDNQETLEQEQARVAAMIVRAVNSHADLVASLETLIDCSNAIVGADPHDPDATEAYEMFHGARSAARTALAKARAT